MNFQTGRFLHKIPYIKGGGGSRTMVFFYGASALLTSLEKSSIREHLKIIGAYVPKGFTYYIFGYEQYPKTPYDLNEIAADFARIIEQEIGKTVIVGVSFGGFVAMRFAAKYPALTEKLVLLISAHTFSAPGKKKIGKMKLLVNEGRYYELLKENTLLFRRWWLNLAARFLLWKNKKAKLSGLNSSTALKDSLEGIFSLQVYDNIAYLGKIRAETLIIGGTKDQFFGVDEFRQTAGYIKDARLQLFAEETHMLPIEKNKEAGSVVKSFIRHSLS